MKRYYLLLILIYSSSWGQNWPTEEFAKNNNYREVVGDTIGTNQKLSNVKFAMYPDGKEGINSLIINNIRFPNTTELPKNDGRVLLEYIVDVNGRIVEIKILQSAGKPYDDEAIRVLKKMERWIPAIKDGKAVRVSYKQPFKFG